MESSFSRETLKNLKLDNKLVMVYTYLMTHNTLNSVLTYVWHLKSPQKVD